MAALRFAERSLWFLPRGFPIRFKSIDHVDSSQTDGLLSAYKFIMRRTYPKQRLIHQPPTPVRSIDELMAIAYAMEKESIDRYANLAKRMAAAGRDDLASVFERLVREETVHMNMVVAWSQQSRHHAPAVADYAPGGVFDDEGAALISPELQDIYQSFAMAVRNEERAFVFWAYVAADAPMPEVREAAERLAQEELQHAKVLRRERRKAFFADRFRKSSSAAAPDLVAIERKIATILQALAESSSGNHASNYRALATEADQLADDLAAEPLYKPPFKNAPSASSLEALCEWLAEHYIEAGETLPSQAGRDRAQELATAAIERLALIRDLESSRS